MNAMWQVRFLNLTSSFHDERVLTLMSRDGKDPRKAHKLARDTAKARLEKKFGKGKIKILGSACVG